MRGADDLTSFMCPLSWNPVASTSWNPQSLPRPPVQGLLCIFYLMIGRSFLFTVRDEVIFYV